ncbi:hypothetical protein PGTUg99_029432 [Puccinia graminis f. sp. tritici]|uniref:Uncharacterized protein n=1 Tax=Puccinia graminis f. sp. tritici TaxID=56615 RepID=A0A5B0S011_PUCGR|nr:hypothetical protein PGTUg99_029432 [Puccinia graminis f. sp. tritici]
MLANLGDSWEDLTGTGEVESDVESSSDSSELTSDLEADSTHAQTQSRCRRPTPQQ